MVKIRHFCYLFEMRNDLSVTVQIGIPQAFCTDKIPCETHLMVHDDIDITTRVSSKICTNKSADFRRSQLQETRVVISMSSWTMRCV